MNKFFLLLISLLSFVCSAQNLVPNSSFEDFDKNEPFFSSLKNWKNANKNKESSPDLISFKEYYKRVSPQEVKIKSGIGCLGLGLLLEERVEVQLLDTLLKEEEYLITMYVILNEKNCYGTNVLPVFLSDSLMSSSLYKKNTPIVLKPADSTKIINKKEWILVKGKYKAKGGESYLMIGMFYKKNWDPYIYKIPIPKQELSVYKNVNPSFYNSAYLFIDDVSLVSLNTQKKAYAKDNIVYQPEKAEKIILKDISFKTNSAILENNTFSTLDSLVEVLNKEKTLKVEINGYTDNVGDSLYNNVLSEKRALSVKDYLASKRIELSRITCKGWGMLNPICENNTEIGRKNNRRVEIRIIR